MAKIKVSEIRAKFPMYQDLNDDQLISGIRQKFYSDIPIGKFAGMIEYDTQREALGKELTDGMSATDTLRAGFGKAFSDTGAGLSQLFGGTSRADVDETAKRDAALMNTTGGKVGNFSGMVAQAVPTVALPFAAGLRGAALVGGAMGGLQPVGTEDSRLQNIGIGGAAGAGGVAAGRLLVGGAQAARALVDPFTDAGQQKIAGRVIQRFADDPTKVAAATGQRSITGALPTIAEETGDAGMARLQDAVRAMDPQIGNRIGQRLSDNNAARVGVLQGMAGDSTQRAAAETAREAASGDLYQQATKAAYTVDDQLSELLSRPAVKAAMGRAQTLAQNQGRSVSFNVTAPNPFAAMGVPTRTSKQINGQALQDLKMAMDEMLSDPASGFTGKAGDTIRNLRGQLVGWMEEANPAFKAGRVAYREASKPLNAMDVGAELARRATSNTSDLAGNPRMQANALMGMLRDEPALIERATGRKGINALMDVMQPQDLNLLRTVASEADRTAAVASAGAGPGSATAQRIASQNVISRLAGPTGIPDSWAEGAIANTVIGKPLNLLYGGVAEPKIQQALAEAVLDPAKARAFLAMAQKQGWKLPNNTVTQLMGQAARTSVPAAALPQPGGR